MLTKLQQMQPASLPNWGARVNRGFLVNRMESLDRLGELPDFVRSSAPAARKPSGGTSTSIDQRDHRHEIHELPSRLLRSASTESPGAVLSEEDVAAIMTAVTRGEAFNDLIDASDTETLDKACRAFRLELPCLTVGLTEDLFFERSSTNTSHSGATTRHSWIPVWLARSKAGCMSSS